METPIENNYHKHDHSHCWESKKSPCGQNIKHFECCLCKELHPQIYRMLHSLAEGILGVIPKDVQIRCSDCSGMLFCTCLEESDTYNRALSDTLEAQKKFINDRLK